MEFFWVIIKRDSYSQNTFGESSVFFGAKFKYIIRKYSPNNRVALLTKLSDFFQKIEVFIVFVEQTARECPYTNEQLSERSHIFV